MMNVPYHSQWKKKCTSAIPRPKEPTWKRVETFRTWAEAMRLTFIYRLAERNSWSCFHFSNWFFLDEFKILLWKFGDTSCSPGHSSILETPDLTNMDHIFDCINSGFHSLVHINFLSFIKQSSEVTSLPVSFTLDTPAEILEYTI